MKKLVLVLLLAIAFLLNFFPHLHYSYPLHVDEWVHFTYANHISNGDPLYFGGESNTLESGFHLLLASLNSLGVPYLFMFRFFAAFFTVLICLALFIAVRKFFGEDAALFSVLFIVILKSTVALLGPMFLVPLSLGLFFIPIGLYLAESRFLFLVIGTTLIMHPPSGIALLILLNCYLIIERKNIKGLLFQQFLGILVSLPLFLTSLQNRGLSNLQFDESFISILSIPQYLGYVVTGLSILGFYLIIYRKKYSFFIYSLFLLFLAFIYYNFRVNILIFYERNLMYLFESFAVPFGVGCAFLVSKFKRFSNVALVVFLVLLLIFTIPGKADSTSKVYHLINDNQYNDFVWIKDNASGRAVLDPWLAIAFTPLAGKEVYSRVPQGPDEEYLNRNIEVSAFFKSGCSDVDFLHRNNISIVYGKCTASKEIHTNVYSL